MSYDSGYKRGEEGKTTPASILDVFTSQNDDQTNKGFEDGRRDRNTAQTISREIAKKDRR